MSYFSYFLCTVLVIKFTILQRLFYIFKTKKDTVKLNGVIIIQIQRSLFFSQNKLIFMTMTIILQVKWSFSTQNNDQGVIILHQKRSPGHYSKGVIRPAFFNVQVYKIFFKIFGEEERKKIKIIKIEKFLHQEKK